MNKEITVYIYMMIFNWSLLKSLKGLQFRKMHVYHWFNLQKLMLKKYVIRNGFINSVCIYREDDELC